MNLLTSNEVAGAVERAIESVNQYTWDDDAIDSKARALLTEFADRLVDELRK